jgi:hypothetical protein
VPWNDEVSADQTTTGTDQALDQGRGDPERWVRHHFEWTTRETEISAVDTNDGHAALTEMTPQISGALWMQLNRDNVCVRRDERLGYWSSSRPDVENKITGKYASISNEAARPATIELMPPPPWPANRGHGGPSPCSKTCV